MKMFIGILAFMIAWHLFGMWAAIVLSLLVLVLSK